MRKPLSISILTIAFVWANGLNVTLAEKPQKDASEMIREIFVPFEDLSVLLENQPRRVLLSRAEYEELLAKAEEKPTAAVPHKAVIISADYKAFVEQERVNITGTLVVDVLEEGLHTVGLQLADVGLRRAGLDGKGAPIGLADDGRLMLFVAGKGRHRLVLEMVAPLEITAAQQILNFEVPTPASTRLQLIVPGDVEVKSGAETITRVLDQDAGVTRFELLPKRGRISLLMTLNSRLIQKQRVVVARSVMVDEVTEAYERIHATCSMAVLHGVINNFQFTVPEGFEVTNVKSPLLASWGIINRNDRNILDIRLREPTTETVVLNLSAIKTPVSLDSWQLPKLEPLEVEGQATVVGVLVEDRLKVKSVEATGLIPVDVAVLHQALPATVFEAVPGAPRIRPVLAYYAPREGFTLVSQFEKPPPKLLVTTNILLMLEEKRQQVRGGFTLLPQVEKLFELDFSVPKGWQVTSVTTEQGDTLAIEHYDEAEETTRIHVRLPQGVPTSEQYRIYFHATCAPVGWLDDWPSTPVVFPVFAVAGAIRETGAIAVAAHEDLTVRPDTLERLTPLDEDEKDDYGLGGVLTNLAYRFEDQSYRAELIAERITPRLTARTYSFFTINPDVLAAHYEIAYDVEESRTQRLSLILPESTPAALSIRGLDDVALKEYTSEPAGNMRRWTVLLAEARRDRIRLAVDFQQPLAERELADLVLPVVQADGVAYQSGIVAVEGSAELDIQISSKLPKVDVGELVDAQYQPGKRLLGAFGFIGDSPEIKVSVFRHPGYFLPPVIVQKAELVTLLSANGLSQTAARYQLRSKAAFLEVKLPAGSNLWSAELDGNPAKPQRDGQKLLLSMPAAGEETLRDLRIVYETPVSPVDFRTNVEVLAPSLLIRAQGDMTAGEVPVADLVWHLHLPTGAQVVQTGGTVVTDQVPMPELAASSLARFLYRISGGVSYFYGGFGLARARELSKCAVSESRLRTPAEFDGDELMYSYSVGAPEGEGVDHARITEEKGDEAMAGLPMRGFGKTPGRSPVPKHALQIEQPAEKPAQKYWAMEGFRSLKINLEQVGERITFHSLGEKPRLTVTLTNCRRLDALAWGLALAVGLVGLTLTNRSARDKFIFVVSIALATTFLPLITGLPELIYAFNISFYAASLLVPYYLVAWLMIRIKRSVRPVQLPAAATAVLAAMFVLADVSDAMAEAPTKSAAPYVIQVVEPPTPVEVPADALILPYDPKSETGIKDVDQLLVPYDKFVELWNRAYPDKRIETQPPPAQYALAGADFSTTLEGEQYLLMEGHIDIDVYVEEFVTVPLALDGGVLTRADLDGRPARLSIAEKAPSKQVPAQQPTRVQMKGDSPPDSLLVLHVSGKGRHRLDLAARMRFQRHGGWRVMKGRLPASPAGAMNLQVPEEQTEIRLSGVPDQKSYITKKPGESIKTVLGTDGAINLQWRPKVSEGVVDQSLTAKSTAVLDVQEDGLSLTWQLELEFRRSERESIDVQVPRDYLVVKIEGNNVRGWEVRQAEQYQQLEVSLLKPAKDSGSFTIHLWQQGPVGGDKLSEFEAPVITAGGAALHNGQLTIRRSPLLDLRIVSSAGVTRCDLPAVPEENSPVGHRQSPLGVRPYQAYNFAGVPFSVRLAASTISAKKWADLQTILRISERRNSLETQVKVNVQDRDVYHLRLLVPGDLDLEHVSVPGEFEWSLTGQKEQKLLCIHLAAGQRGQVPILIRGTLSERGSTDEVPLPKFRVLEVENQTGDIVVQVDPAYDVRAAGLVKCESVLLERVYGWLKPQQRQLARLALHYYSPDYGGFLRLVARTPDVTCYTITNTRITERAIEETILLNFTIRNAGIRELTFLLPEWMKDSRISVPLLRQKTIEPAPETSENTVRVRVELQDAVMDQLCVLIQNDRLLSDQMHQVPIPVVETGRTDQRYVVLESAGRGEVLVDKREGLDILTHQQKEWRVLAGILGGGITEAYIVSAGTSAPSLCFRVKDRATVETVGARICLAQTLLVLDDSGAYRATQIYRVDNQTEQFLEIQMPGGSVLWTAQVAGEPVKPTAVPDPAKPDHLRIPLIKTSAGDLDYEVLLKYGGELPALGRFSSMQFPLIRAVNINAELSQVRLFLPETYSWFDFEGTMRLVTDEGDLSADYVSYQTKLAEQLTQTMRSSSSFAQLRAASNLQRLQQEIVAYQDKTQTYFANEALQQQLVSNAAVLQQAEQQIRELQHTLAKEEKQDNKESLYKLYEKQQTTRGVGVVISMGSNFGEVVQPATRETDENTVRFNDQWFVDNGLVFTVEPEQKERLGRVVGQAGKKKGKAGKEQRKFGYGGAPLAAPQVAQEEMMPSLQKSLKDTDLQFRAGRRRELGEEGVVKRYRQQLEQRAKEEVGVELTEPVKAGTSLVYVPSDQSAARAGESLAALPAGLASLDVEIPQRGVVYLFTTPRGEVEITARTVSNPFIVNLKKLAVFIISVLALWYICRLFRREDFMEMYGRLLSTILIVVGLIILLIGILPVAALAAIILGILIRTRIPRNIDRVSQPV